MSCCRSSARAGPRTSVRSYAPSYAEHVAPPRLAIDVGGIAAVLVGVVALDVVAFRQPVVGGEIEPANPGAAIGLRGMGRVAVEQHDIAGLGRTVDEGHACHIGVA